jgi:hypothetical protein
MTPKVLVILMRHMQLHPSRGKYLLTDTTFKFLRLYVR